MREDEDEPAVREAGPHAFSQTLLSLNAYRNKNYEHISQLKCLRKDRNIRARDTLERA